MSDETPPTHEPGTEPERPDNVLVFPSLREMKESGGPVSRTPRNWAGCQHDHGVTVYEMDRTVTCKKCLKHVDAFDALLQLATRWDWQHTREAKKAAHAEAEKVSKDLERLKQLRHNARATGAISTASVRKVFAAIVRGLRMHIADTSRSKADDAVAGAYQDAVRLVEHARGVLLDGKVPVP